MAVTPTTQKTTITDGNKTTVLDAAASATDQTVVKPCFIVIRSPTEADVNVDLILDDGTEGEAHTAKLNSTNGYTWVAPMGFQWNGTATTLKADPSASVEVMVIVGYARKTS